MARRRGLSAVILSILFLLAFYPPAGAALAEEAAQETAPPINPQESVSQVSALSKAVEYFKPNLSGYIEAWYRNDSSDLSNQTTAAKKTDNEFRIRRARLTATGNVTEELGYKLTANLDGPSPASASSSVKLWDAYMTYRFNPLIAATFGQFKYDFTLEGLETTPDRVPVLRAEAINDIAGTLGTTGGSFRDIGVKFTGAAENLLGLTYGLDLINGNGINKGDNNNHKDIAGRVTVTPLKGLTLGASGYTGEGQSEISAFRIQETAWDLEAEYKLEGLKLRGEYIRAKWDNWDISRAITDVTRGPAQGKTQKPNGWYLQASYRLPQNVEFMGRFEDYEKDSNTPDSHLRTTTLGAAYYIKGKTRVTANYLIRKADSSNIVTAQETDAAGSNIKNLFIVQALLAF